MFPIDIKKSIKNSLKLQALVGFIFITLKLVGYVTWPWLWVTSPLWSGIALNLTAATMIFVSLVIAVIANFIFG